MKSFLFSSVGTEKMHKIKIFILNLSYVHSAVLLLDSCNHQMLLKNPFEK